MTHSAGLAVELFSRHAKEFHSMRNKQSPFEHLLDDFIFEATKAVRTLFVSIDSGLLVPIWKPKDRPSSNFETISTPKGEKLLKINPNHNKTELARMMLIVKRRKPNTKLGIKAANYVADPINHGFIPISDNKLDRGQLSLNWSCAVENLWRLHPDRFSYDGGGVDILADNEIYVNRDKKGKLKNTADYVRYYRRRAAVYEDACMLLADLIRPQIPKAPYNGSPFNGDRLIPMTQIQLATDLGGAQTTIASWSKLANVPARKNHGEPYTQEELRSILEMGATKNSKMGRMAKKKIEALVTK